MTLHFDMDPPELFIRFSAFAPGVDSAIIGTFSIDHLKIAIDAVEKGELPDEILAQIRKAFKKMMITGLRKLSHLITRATNEK